MNYKILITCLIALLFHASCTKSPDAVDNKILLDPNPTSYTFEIPMDQLRDTIIKVFGIDPQMDNKTLTKIFYYKWPESGDTHIDQAMFEPETSEKATFGIDYFKNKGTTDDLFLTPMADYWYSTMYFHKNKPFEYTSSFVIKFKPISQKNCSITIMAYKPKIFNGTLCCSPHGSYSDTQTVKSTTVEEYTLILYITQKLGINGLKPLQLPK